MKARPGGLSSFTGSGVTDLPEDLARVRETYSRFKLATYEFAQACIEAKRNGRSLRQIAAAADEDLSRETVRRAILAVTQCANPDEFDRKYSSVVKGTNGSQVKSGSEGPGGRSAPPGLPVSDNPPGDNPEVIQGEIVHEDPPDEQAEQAWHNEYFGDLFQDTTRLHGRLLSWPTGVRHPMAEAYLDQISQDIDNIKKGF